MLKTFVNVQHFEKSEDFLTQLLPWKYSCSSAGQGVIFRGQTGDYPLIPNALRDNGANLLKARYSGSLQKTLSDDAEFVKLEFDLLNRFFQLSDMSGMSLPPCTILRNHRHRETSIERVYANSSALPWVDGELQWLPPELEEIAGIAQHYGLPTRLLDWTYDPFIAAFFACKNATTDNENAVLWLFRVGNFGELTDHFAVAPPLRIITPPYAQNPNLAAQRGLFTHWTHKLATSDGHPKGITLKPSKPDCRPLQNLLHEWLLEHESECRMKVHVNGETLSAIHGISIFEKYTLPNAEARQAAYLLAQLGYDYSRIFPGYSGIVKEIMHRC